MTSVPADQGERERVCDIPGGENGEASGLLGLCEQEHTQAQGLPDLLRLAVAADRRHGVELERLRHRGAHVVEQSRSRRRAAAGDRNPAYGLERPLTIRREADHRLTASGVEEASL